MVWRRRGVRVAVLAVLLAGALALLVASRLAHGGSERAGGDLVVASADGGGTDGDEQRFSVTGSVTGLFPGANKDLVVTVKNSIPFPIRVTRLSATVESASAMCTAANLSVGGFTGSREVPAKGSATVTLPVAMSHAAGDGCQGAHFPLLYSAAATRADDGDEPTPGRCGSQGDEPCA